MFEYKWSLEYVQALTWRQFYSLWERMWARKKNDVILQAQGVARGIAAALGAKPVSDKTRSIISDGTVDDAKEFDATQDGVLEHLADNNEISLTMASKRFFDEMGLPNMDDMHREMYGG